MAGVYQLEPRLLNEADQDWLKSFAAGTDWWCHEVAGFLKNDALEQASLG